MSADNWTRCPRCLKNAELEKEDFSKKAREGYGKLTSDEYEVLLLKSREPINLDDSLREDYEFYLDDDGCFTANYRATCGTCNFNFTFHHKQQVEIEPK